MRARKERVTVTVDRHLLAVGSAAVAQGNAESLSGWINQAMADRAAKERRLKALADAVALYEADFGAISAEEMEIQARRDRENAIVVRGRRAGRRSSRKRIAR